MGVMRYIIQLFVKKFHIFMQKKRENLKKLQSKRRNLQEANIDGIEFTMSHMQEHRKV